MRIDLLSVIDLDLIDRIRCAGWRFDIDAVGYCVSRAGVARRLDSIERVRDFAQCVPDVRRLREAAPKRRATA